jgi:hypothetical protein
VTSSITNFISWRNVTTVVLLLTLVLGSRAHLCEFSLSFFLFYYKTFVPWVLNLYFLSIKAMRDVKLKLGAMESQDISKLYYTIK